MKELKRLEYWISKTKLRSVVSTLRCKSYFYLKGHGRHWRIWFSYEQNKLIIQVGETYKTFDRWANSVELTKFIPLSFIKDKNIFNEKNFIIFINEMNNEVNSN